MQTPIFHRGWDNVHFSLGYSNYFLYLCSVKLSIGYFILKMITNEDSILLNLIRITDEGGECVVPDEVILREAKSHVRTFCFACDHDKRNRFIKGASKPSLRYGTVYMAASRRALADEGCAYTEHHMLQIMAVFYVLLRRPYMRSQYNEYVWYIDRLCQYMDEGLFCNPTQSIAPYRRHILHAVEQLTYMHQPDFFTGQAEPILPYIKPKNKPHMGDTYNIQINGGDFIAGGGSKTVNQYNGQPPVETPKPSSQFVYIDLTRCTHKEGQEAEEMLRQVAQKSPREIAGVVHRLMQAQRLRPITSIAGFVREFNNHFGVRLNEQSFYSAFRS